MANFTVDGRINANRAAEAYQELSKMVEGRNYNLGELVLDNGKLTKVNHHASGWFANDRVTTETENKRVRKAVNAVIRQHWAGATEEKKVLLEEISNRLIGKEFKSLPLTRREVCAYLKMMGGYLTGNDQNALEKKAGEIKLELREKLQQVTDDIVAVQERIGELSVKQELSEDETRQLDELNGELTKLRNDEIKHRHDLSDENVKSSALKWLFEGRVTRVFGAEHGQFGFLRDALDNVNARDRLAKNSVAGFATSQNVLRYARNPESIRLECLKGLMVEVKGMDNLQGEDRSNEIRGAVLRAFIQDAHFNVVSGSPKRLLLLGQVLKNDWNVSIEDVMGGIQTVASKIAYDKACRLMSKIAPKLHLLATYNGGNSVKTENALFRSLQASVDAAFSELNEKMSVLIGHFEQALPAKMSQEDYEERSGNFTRSDQAHVRGYETLMDHMTSLVNEFTEKVFELASEDGLAGRISKMSEEAVAKKRNDREIFAGDAKINAAAKRQKIQEIQQDIDFLRNFPGTSSSIDLLKDQLDRFNNSYVKSQRSGLRTDVELFADFDLKRKDDRYLAALSSKMKPLLGRYTSNSLYNQNQLAVMLPNEPEDIRNALGLFSIEDLREKVGSLKDKEFQTFYLRAGLDADQLLEFVDFGFAFLSDDRIVTFRDALRNMSARISELSGSNRREDLVEAGKLLTSLKQMRIRMGRILELTKDVKIPDRTEQEKKFAITEKLSEAVSRFAGGGGSDKEHESVDSENMFGGARSNSDIARDMQMNAAYVDGVKETRVAVNDVLVSQLESLRKFCEPLNAVFANSVNGGDNRIDIDALERKLVNSVNQFNQEGAGNPIDFTKEVPVDAKQQAEWNAYAKNLTSLAVQQLSPNALTGGPLKYDPNFSGYPQIKIDDSKI